jgi:ribose-phosphate pyrophosphokinase
MNSLDINNENDLVSRIRFPSGEHHVRINAVDDGDIVELVWSEPNGDIMVLGMAVDACRRGGASEIHLLMPFVPYARQDRIAVPGDPLSIKVFTDFLNSLNLNSVTIFDPHSDVTSALINNCQVVEQHQFASSALLSMNSDTIDPVAIVAPDLGAAKKAKKLQAYVENFHNLKFPVIQCDKSRNPHTGQLTGFQVIDGSPYDHDCLIVDDICDGGGTFLGLAEVLNNEGARRLGLYVTHGLFTKGIDLLASKFRLFTTRPCQSHVANDSRICKISVHRSVYA